MNGRSSILTMKYAPYFPKLGSLLVAGLIIGLGAPLAAQDSEAAQDDRARIDDFSISSPSRSSVVQIEQLSSNRRDVTAQSALPVKRSVAIPNLNTQASAQESRPIAQVSAAKPDTDAAAVQENQISNSSQSREIAARSISTSDASRPVATERLSGTDRCAPGEDAAQTEECADILEERASEFASTQAPSLSTQQALTANNSDGTSSGDTLASRLDMAARSNPNANVLSNQEIASLYLDPATASQLDQTQSQDNSALVEAVVQALQGTGSGP